MYLLMHLRYFCKHDGPLHFSITLQAFSYCDEGIYISFFMCGLLYMKHVSIYVLSTQFSTYFLHVFRFPTFFFPHSLKFPFSLFSTILTTSFKSSTVMAHHKSHFPPSRLNNGYGIFAQIVVLQLSPPASFVLLLLPKKGDLWLTRYKNRVIKIQIFIMGSSKIQI